MMKVWDEEVDSSRVANIWLEESDIFENYPYFFFFFKGDTIQPVAIRPWNCFSPPLMYIVLYTSQ